MSKVSSCASIIRGRIRGMIHLLIAITNQTKHSHSSNIINILDPLLLSFANKAIVINNSIATISCTIKIPIEILPYTVSVSWASFNSFTITIVLEKLSPIANNIDVTVSNHSIRSSTNQSNTQIPTWIRPTLSAIFPCSFIVVGFNHNPTRNNSNEIPSWEKKAKNELWSPASCCTIPNDHITTPAIRYQIMRGCLSNFTIPVTTKTSTKISPSCPVCGRWAIKSSIEN